MLALITLHPFASAVNLQKCIIYCRDPNDAAVRAAFPGIPVGNFRPFANFTVLGVPAGSAEFNADYVKKVLSLTIDKLEKVKQLDAHEAFYLLRSCLSFGPGVYYARTVVPTSEVLQEYATFDTHVKGAVERKKNKD